MIDHERIRFFGDIATVQAETRGGETALVSGEEELSYSDLAERAGRTMTALAAEGVSEGDRLCWIGGNGTGWFAAFFATVGLRACFAPLNFRLNPAELAYILEDSGAKLLVAAEDQIALAEAAAVAMPSRYASLPSDSTGRALTGSPSRTPNRVTRCPSGRMTISCSSTPAAPPGFPRECG